MQERDNLSMWLYTQVLVEKRAGKRRLRKCCRRRLEQYLYVSYENKLGKCGMDSSGAGYGLVAIGEHGNETSRPIG